MCACLVYHITNIMFTQEIIWNLYYIILFCLSSRKIKKGKEKILISLCLCLSVTQHHVQFVTNPWLISWLWDVRVSLNYTHQLYHIVFWDVRVSLNNTHQLYHIVFWDVRVSLNYTHQLCQIVFWDVRVSLNYIILFSEMWE